jgi:hypothetical protein
MQLHLSLTDNDHCNCRLEDMDVVVDDARVHYSLTMTTATRSTAATPLLAISRIHHSLTMTTATAVVPGSAKMVRSSRIHHSLTMTTATLDCMASQWVDIFHISSMASQLAFCTQEWGSCEWFEILRGK